MTYKEGKMKNATKTLLASVLALGLFGCSNTSAPETATDEGTEIAADHLARINSAGELVIGLEGNWQPFSFEDDNGNIIGYDAEVGQEIAKRIGVDAKIVPTAWDGLFAGLDAGVFDVVINGCDITPDRQEKYEFSTPYAYDYTVLIVRDDNKDIKSFDDLNGKKTANSTGSTYEQLGVSYGATCSNVETLAETLELVKNGTVDATINASTSFGDFMKTSGGPFVIVDQSDAVEYGIPMVKGDDNATFVEAVNKALDDMRKDGTLKALSEKYFDADLTSPK